MNTLRPLLLVSALLMVTGCATGMRLESPACETMRAQIKEKQKLDASVKALSKEARTYRTQGDTAAANAAERRLGSLLESQRFLKDALDATSRDCSSIVKDVEPVLDPALREKQRLDGTR